MLYVWDGATGIMIQSLGCRGRTVYQVSAYTTGIVLLASGCTAGTINSVTIFDIVVTR